MLPPTPADSRFLITFPEVPMLRPHYPLGDYYQILQKNGLLASSAPLRADLTRSVRETICFEGDGCLSVPDLSGSTKRYAWIDVEYYNEKGELIKERLSGQSRGSDFTGVIFQHEFDHLQGILFIDRLFDGASSLQRSR